MLRVAQRLGGSAGLAFLGQDRCIGICEHRVGWLGLLALGFLRLVSATDGRRAFLSGEDGMRTSQRDRPVRERDRARSGSRRLSCL